MFVKITAIETDDPKKSLDSVLESMDEEMRAWTSRAARMECGWICADCCGSDTRGMPDECFHGNQWCTDINQRDKKNAWAEVQKDV